MKRAAYGLLMMAGGLFGTAPQHVEAQLNVQVALTWELGDHGWVSYRPVYTPAREVVDPTPRQRVRVPPGHMPRPGYCRLWYPGVPPGHQPPAEPCERLFGARWIPAGAVIVGAPAHDVVYVDDRGRGHGNGRKKGRR